MPLHNALTSAERGKIFALSTAGDTRTEIAKKTGRSYHTVCKVLKTTLTTEDLDAQKESVTRRNPLEYIQTVCTLPLSAKTKILIIRELIGE